MGGEAGMQWEKKSFSVGMGGAGAIALTTEEQAEQDQLKAEREADAKRTQQETKERLERIGSQRVTRKLVPYGTRILVKKRKVEQKSAHIVLPDEVLDLPTDIADVVAVPDQSFADRQIIANAAAIIAGLTAKATQGDAAAVDALLKLNEYLRVMALQPGDVLLLARYGGTDFLIQETNQNLCVTDANGIYALVIEKRN